MPLRLEAAASKNITSDKLIAAAQRMLHLYVLDVKEVAWWSVYEIGQRLTDKFDDVPAGEEATRSPRVFIAGDACHTHSPKAGQGMNVSMQDAFNLGWKLSAVLRGLAEPRLLHSYSSERRAIAQELIDFDREFAASGCATTKRPSAPTRRRATSTMHGGSTASRGCLVVVRPDQYVARVLPLDARDALADYFTGVLRRAQGLCSTTDPEQGPR
jgi:2-polyprenyl-6-methoxyphenol hydroxylase-like FAD-dependent oxidoreductase